MEEFAFLHDDIKASFNFTVTTGREAGGDWACTRSFSPKVYVHACTRSLMHFIRTVMVDAVQVHWLRTAVFHLLHTPGRFLTSPSAHNAPASQPFPPDSPHRLGANLNQGSPQDQMHRINWLRNQSRCRASWTFDEHEQCMDEGLLHDNETGMS